MSKTRYARNAHGSTSRNPLHANYFEQVDISSNQCHFTAEVLSTENEEVV